MTQQMLQPGYDSSKFVHVDDIAMNNKTTALLKKATACYRKHFPEAKTWYGRCIFVSWHCPLDCSFCFRAAPKHKKQHPSNKRRSMGSMLIEALFCKIFKWRIEFLTGGYGTMTYDELIEVIKNVSAVYGEKIWLNFGVLPPAFIEKCRPYVKGITASMETLHPKIHQKVCPKKPIKPYNTMLTNITGMMKSIAVIVGLGDTQEDIHYLFEAVEKHNLDRVTIYALKPVPGSPFTEGPSPEEYVWWIASLRLKFPTLEIIAGTNLRRCEEAGYLMKAGANAVTKFPVTKQFGTQKAKLVTQFIEQENRNFFSNLTVFPDVNWDREIDALPIKDQYKQEMKQKLPSYLKTFKNPVDKDKYVTLHRLSSNTSHKAQQ